MRNTVNEHIAKDKILKAAKTEFARKGFQGSRMDKIAEQAGVNKALVHYYFQSKEKLYETVLSSKFGKNDSQFDVPVFMGEKNLTYSQKIYLLVYVLVMSYFKSSDNEYNDIILWEIAEGSEILRKIHDEIMMPRIQSIMKIIKDGINNGEFESKNPELVMIGLATMIQGFKIEEQRKIKATLFKIDNSSFSENEYLDFCLEYFFKMLSPAGKILKIPGMPEEIIAYIDKLLELIKAKGITENIITQIFNLLAE